MLSVFSHSNAAESSEVGRERPKRRRRTTPDTTRTTDTTSRNHETSCCTLKARFNQCGALSTIKANMASKAKNRKKPWDAGRRSDCLDSQMIGMEPIAKTNVETIVSLLVSAFLYGESNYHASIERWGLLVTFESYSRRTATIRAVDTARIAARPG